MVGGKSNIVLLGLEAWLCVHGIWVKEMMEERVGWEVGRSG